MTDTRYYPLIDCDTEGTEKVPMFPTSTRKAVSEQARMWLEETVPHYYKLRVGFGHHPTDPYSIRCPLCGKEMRCISRGINEEMLGLYVCGSCKKH